MKFRIVCFVVPGTSVRDACHTVEELSADSVQSLEEPVPDDEISTEHDEVADTNVVWTVVDKRKLVELVGKLTTVGDSGGQFEESASQSVPAVDDELPLPVHRRRDETTSGDLTATSLDSPAEKSWQKNTSRQQSDPPRMRDQNAALVQKQNPSLLKSNSCEDLAKREEVVGLPSAISSCSGVPKNNLIMATSKVRSCRKPISATVSGTAGNPDTAPKKVGRGSSEAWTSVDKTLVEDLFDQLLQSFDDVEVSRPEVDRTGSDGSRRPPSANRRPSHDDVTNDVVRGGLWQSAAYKWKSHILQRMRTSHILQRMRTQQLTKHSQCRKRRYADRKLVQNAAF